MDQESSKPSRNPQANPGVAAVLSLFFPWTGHIYAGYIGTGLFMLVLTYALFWPLYYPNFGLPSPHVLEPLVDLLEKISLIFGVLVWILGIFRGYVVAQGTG
ncbi:MAG TPA: hypothetical protein VGK54_11150 [Chloroflexota bacterium]|jgi:hypothetical protein